MISDAPNSDPRSKAAAFFVNVTGLPPVMTVCGHLDERLQALALYATAVTLPDGRVEETAHRLAVQMRFRAIDWL